MSNERIQQARVLWEKFPANDLARFNLAQALFDADAFSQAAEHLRALAAKKNDWMVVHILLGKCLLAQGQRDEGQRILQHAHQLAVAQRHDGPREELEDLLGKL